MIFPGMDPYLEHPDLWTGVHARLVVYIADALQPLLRPRYVAAVEERVYVEGTEHHRVPDVWIKPRRRPAPGGALAVLESDEPVTVTVAQGEVRETYVAILDRFSKQRLVTLIEVVSPTNKFDGPGRASYVRKQQEVRGSDAHLVEIDLLRTGHHVAAVPEWAVRQYDPYAYLSCVNRAQGERAIYEVYLRPLRNRLPKIRIPLAAADPDVILDVQSVVEQAYDAGSYDDRIDYDKPCLPPLSVKDQAWAAQLIRKAFGRERPTKRTNGKRK